MSDRLSVIAGSNRGRPNEACPMAEPGRSYCAGLSRRDAAGHRIFLRGYVVVAPFFLGAV